MTGNGNSSRYKSRVMFPAPWAKASGVARLQLAKVVSDAQRSPFRGTQKLAIKGTL